MLSNAGTECASCLQRDIGQARLLPDGLVTSGVVVVGDSPWKDEIRRGQNFSGAAGSLLDRLIRSVGRERSEFGVANTIWCCPPSLGWTDKPAAAPGLASCRPYLDDYLAQVRPRCIVPMGNVALRRICDTTGIEAHHGYVHETAYGPAVPTFHPAFLIRGTSEVEGAKARNLRYFPVVVFDLQRALEVAGGRFQRQPTEYLLDPTLVEAQAYVERCWERQLVEFDKYSFSCNRSIQANTGQPSGRIPLVFLDLETPESAKAEGQEEEAAPAGRALKLAGPILRVSISLWPGTAVSVPWQEPFIQWFKEVVERADSIAAWNGYDADFPKLRAESVLGGGGSPTCPVLVDPMWCWHFLQSDLPKALGFVAPFFYDGPAWKHLSGSDPAYYNAIDSDAGLRCLLGTRQALERQGRWHRFVRHCIETWPVFEQMGFIAVDSQQQAAFQARLKQEVAAADATLQTHVPETVKPVKRWKRAPKDMAGVRPRLSELGEEQGLLVESAQAGVLITEPVVVGWERVEPFNPRSSDQVAKLIRHLGLKMPMKRGEDRETTEAKYLRRFAKKHEVFRWVLECRERSTMLSTFMWQLDEAGLVHTTFMWHPSTWRKSSRAYNLQNIPKRSDLAHEFRRMLVARPRHVLVEADASAIEAVLVGYSAGSESYIRLAKAGVHDWLASHIVGRPISLDLPDDELVAACRAIKREFPVRREAAKRCIHGSNYLLTAYGIYDEYAEYFPEGKKQAQALQDLYFSLPPGQDVKRWQQRTMERAHAEHYLDNHFGYRHHFYDVFVWDRKREGWGLGGDAKRAVAFGPQSDASAIQTEILLALAETEARDWLRLIVHDSFILEVPETQEARAVELLERAMTVPWLELSGLSVGCEVKVGRNLASRTADNPDGMRGV